MRGVMGSTRLFSSYHSDGRYWFRILGVGLSFVDSMKHLPGFSERNGYTRFLYVGRWRVTFLKQAVHETKGPE